MLCIVAGRELLMGWSAKRFAPVSLARCAEKAVRSAAAVAGCRLLFAVVWRSAFVGVAARMPARSMRSAAWAGRIASFGLECGFLGGVLRRQRKTCSF